MSRPVAAETTSGEKRLERERRARLEAERIAEEVTRQLYDTIAELRRTNDDLEAANRVRADILAVAWHEVRTPLTVLRGFAEVLVHRWSALGDGERFRFAATVSEHAEALAARLDELATASALQSGAVTARPEAFTLLDALGDAVALAGGDVAVTVSCDRALHVSADRRHVESIVTAFVRNALAHGAPPVQVAAARTGDSVEIRVTDTGPGVPDGFEERMFEPLSQADMTSTRSTGGIGVGLALARGLAEICGGDVWYEPAPRGGACFGLRLPAGAPETAV